MVLRKWNESDLNNLVKYANNINIANRLTNGFPHPYTEEDGKAYLSTVTNDNPTKVFAIEVNGEAVGSIGIFPQTDIHEKNAEMGYWLAKLASAISLVVKSIFLKQDAAAFAQPVFPPIFLPEPDVWKLRGSPAPRFSDLF